MLLADTIYIFCYTLFLFFLFIGASIIIHQIMKYSATEITYYPTYHSSKVYKEITRKVVPPFHCSFCLCPSVAIQSSKLALVFLDSGCNTVGEVLSAVSDHVPGDDNIDNSNICNGAYLVTLCWAVKAQGHGHILERVARWEHSRRSRGIQELSIRRSEIFKMIFLLIYVCCCKRVVIQVAASRLVVPQCKLVSNSI